MNSEIGVRHIVTTPTGSCTVSEIARPLGHHERGKSGGAVSGTCVTRTHLLLFQTKDHTSPDENKQLGTRVPSAKTIYQRENASELRISQKQAGVHRAEAGALQQNWTQTKR